MEKINGINFAPFSKRGMLATEEAFAALRQMREQTGANTVLFCPGAVQDTPYSETVAFSGPETSGDGELLAITRYAKDLGLRVFWKPTVNCRDGAWRAHINFFDHDVPTEPQWGPWFAGYTAFQVHFARLAQQAGIELLILGCEMTNTERREADWRALIAAVRSVYAGAVSYNCDKYGEEYVPWWDALDVLAASGYYPLGQIDQNLARIEQTVRRYNKPFFFAEAGCMRIAGSSARPNDWHLQGTADEEEQARWYRDLFAAIAKHPWFGGTALWDWPIRPDPANHYAFRDTPALAIIREAYKAR